MRADAAVVLDDGGGVDDGVLAELGVGVDHCPREHLAAVPEPGEPGDRRGGMDDRGEPKPSSSRREKAALRASLETTPPIPANASATPPSCNSASASGPRTG